MSRRFAFMHVPKTAGIAFAEAIRAATAAPGDVFGFDRHQFGSFDAFDELDEAQRSLVRLEASDWPEGIGLVRGHVTLGTLRAAYPRHELITVLREPRSRLISLWLFWRAQSETDMRSWGGWGERVGAARGPFGRFLANPLLATQTDNVLVRLLLAPHPLVPPEGFITHSADRLLLPAARAALAGFDFVGLVEDRALGTKLGRFLERPAPLGRHNVTAPAAAPLRPAFDEELTPATLDLLERRSRLDQQLWAGVAAEMGLDVAAQTAFQRAVQGYRINHARD